MLKLSSSTQNIPSVLVALVVYDGFGILVRRLIARLEFDACSLSSFVFILFRGIQDIGIKCHRLPV